MLQLLCNACKGEFPASSFHKAATTSRGYQYKCKACVSITDKSPTPEARLRKLEKLKEWVVENPDKRREQKRRHYEKHKDRIDQRAKEWYDNNKDRHVHNALLRKYGVTLEQYNLLRAQQGFCCAICNDHEDSVGKKMFVDHDHVTGKIRKLLCTKCNVGIGMLKDNPDIMERAAKYLRDHNG
jgi:hypothetical protein